MRVIPLVVLILCTASAATADYGLVPDRDFLRVQVKEPVFAMVFAMVEADSLGTWTRRDVEDFATAWDRPSDFPLEYLVAIRREVAPPEMQVQRRGYVCERIITIELESARLDMPMPYSILGYHPGTLGFGSPLVIREWRLGTVELHVRTDEGSHRETVSGFTIFQMIAGWTILDVDGWLDTLLGRNLDDAATLAFSTCRAGGRIVGVGTNVGRTGRSIYGELDFRRGTVMTHGRPLARAISAAARPFAIPDNGNRLEAWQGYDDADQ